MSWKYLSFCMSLRGDLPNVRWSCFYSWPGRVQTWTLCETYKQVSGWWSTHDAVGLVKMTLWKIFVISKAGHFPRSVNCLSTLHCFSRQHVRQLSSFAVYTCGGRDWWPESDAIKDWPSLLLPVSATTQAVSSHLVRIQY